MIANVYVYTFEQIEGGRVGAREGVAFIETLDPSSACQRTTDFSWWVAFAAEKRRERIEPRRAAKKEESEET